MHGQMRLVCRQTLEPFKTELQEDFRALFTGGKRLCDFQQIFVWLGVLPEQHDKVLWYRGCTCLYAHDLLSFDLSFSPSCLILQA